MISNNYLLFVLSRFFIISFFIVFICAPLKSYSEIDQGTAIIAVSGVQNAIDTSASSTAENISTEQRLLAGVAGTAASIASMKAIAACSGKSDPSCPYLAALAAGLFGATYLALSESEANQNLAAEYQGCSIKGPAYEWRGSESYGECVSLTEECTQLGGTWAPIENKCLLPEEACIKIGRNWNRQKQECEDPNDPNDNRDDCSTGKIRIDGECKTPTPKECVENGGVMLNNKCVKENRGGGGGIKDELEEFIKKNGIKWDPKKQQITLPNGVTGSAKDINKALSNLSPQQLQPFKQALSTAAKLSNKANSKDLDHLPTEAESAEGGGGNKSFKGYAKSRRGRGSSGLSHSNTLAQRQNKKNRQLNKLTIRAGNNQIGVSQNSIFQMVHDRYQIKRQNKEFIK